MNLDIDISKPESLFVMRKGVEVPIENELAFHTIEANPQKIQVRLTPYSMCTINKTTFAQHTGRCSATRSGSPRGNHDHTYPIVSLHTIQGRVLPHVSRCTLGFPIILMILSYNWQIL